MKRRKLSDTLITVLMTSVKRPRGHRLLLEFLRDIQAGVIQRTAVTNQLAEAFEAIVFDKHDPADALGLKLPRKRPRQSAGDRAQRQSLKVLRFLYERIERDPKKSGASTRAVKKAADKFSYDERSVWRIWQNRESAKEIKFESIALEAAKSALELNRQLTESSSDIRRLAEFTEMIRQQQPVIDAYAATLSPKKRAAFLELDGQECYRIAAAAARKTTDK